MIEEGFFYDECQRQYVCLWCFSIFVIVHMLEVIFNVHGFFLFFFIFFIRQVGG